MRLLQAILLSVLLIIPTLLAAQSRKPATLAAQPPHPHAAALFVDFLLGSSSRKILEKFQYGHPSNEMPFKRWHPGFGRSLEQFERDTDKWERLAKEISQR